MSEQFSTKDLHLAALFYAKGVLFITVDRTDRVCWFAFENKKLCQELQQAYFAKSVNVNAKEYVDALRTLKDLIFSR